MQLLHNMEGEHVETLAARAQFNKDYMVIAGGKSPPGSPRRSGAGGSSSSSSYATPAAVGFNANTKKISEIKKVNSKQQSRI